MPTPPVTRLPAQVAMSIFRTQTYSQAVVPSGDMHRPVSAGVAATASRFARPWPPTCNYLELNRLKRRPSDTQGDFHWQ
jgi:hypothetical protein